MEKRVVKTDSSLYCPFFVYCLQIKAPLNW